MRIAVWIVVALMIWASPMIANGREKLTAITGDGEFTLGAPPPDMEALGFKPSLLSDPPGQTTWFRSEESPRYPGQVGSERMVVVIDGVVDHTACVIYTDNEFLAKLLYEEMRSMMLSTYDIEARERSDGQLTAFRDDAGHCAGVMYSGRIVTMLFARSLPQD